MGVADAELENLVAHKLAVSPTTLRRRMRWLRKPWSARCWADPRLVEHDGRLFFCHEELSFGSTKGRLRWSQLAADGTRALRGAPIISLNGHASCPHVFEYLDVFCCVPETGLSNRVTLYKTDTPLGPWIEHGIVPDGLPARETTLVHFGDSLGAVLYVCWNWSSIPARQPAHLACPGAVGSMATPSTSTGQGGPLFSASGRTSVHDRWGTVW